jgi:sugar phosphate isomerase/epimerase
MGKPALQLYSIRGYIKKVGLAKALEDVAKIGYKGIEFAGYYNFKAKELKKMLDDNGLVACGTHVGRDAFSPKNIVKTMDFEQEYGNKFICCPGGGNHPPKRRKGKGPSLEDFMKGLVEYYNVAAETAGKRGMLIGLHNHTWEFEIKMKNGMTYWDYFFSNTSKAVQMEQDVGWTTCAGFDPCEQYIKYPNRSYTLHAKENGMGKGVKQFDAILGKPGKPGAKGVEWDRLFPVTDKDGVEWYVVECEKHCNNLNAVKPSFDFLKSKGRV